MKKHYVLYVLLAFFSLGFSQTPTTIVTIDRDNLVVGPTNTGNDPTISSSGLVRGSGINYANPNVNNHSSNGWDANNLAFAQANNEYIEWSTTAGAFNEINISGLDIRVRTGDKGPKKFDILYSLDNFATPGSSLTGEITAPTTGTNFSFNNLNVNSGVAGTITFRLYAYNATGNNNSDKWFRILRNTDWADYGISEPGIKLAGTITEVVGPEPTPAAIVVIDRDNVEVGPTATGNDPSITSIGLTRGSGIAHTTGGVLNHTSSQWDGNTLDQARDNNEYIEWSTTAGASNEITITRLDLNVRRNTQGPKNFQLVYSLDNFATAGTLAGGERSIEVTAAVKTIDNLNIASGTGGTITFRLYAYNVSGGNSDNGWLRILTPDNQDWSDYNIAAPGIRLTGTIIAVAQPGMYYGVWEINGGNWTTEGWLNGVEPTATTGNQNAYVLGGTYEVTKNVQINNLVIEPGATAKISPGYSISSNGTIINAGNLELNSFSTSYSSLITDNIQGEVVYHRHVNRFASAGTDTGHNDLVSAPVTNMNQTFLALITANNQIPSGTINGVSSYLFGPFDNDLNNYINFTEADDNTVIEAGIGYRTASLTQPIGSTFKFVGDVETGTVNVPITVGTGNNFNLIGNPYPSYVDLSMFLAENSEAFNPNRYGVYAYVGNMTNGFIPMNEAYAAANTEVKIAPGQGFMVASPIGGSTISFTPSMRITGTTNDFIPSRPANQNLANLSLLVAKGDVKAQTDLYFNDNASLGMDLGYDSEIFDHVAPDFAIYSHLVEDNAGKAMAAQSVSYSDLENVTIPLGIHMNQGEQAVVSISEHSIPEGTTVVLEDNVTNTFTNLLEGDYTITASSTLTGTGRFYIHFSQVALGLNDQIMSSLQIYTDARQKAIVVKGQLEGQTSFTLYDIQGRVVNAQTLSSKTNEHSIDVSNMTSGVYIVELNNTAGSRTQKVIIR